MAEPHQGRTWLVSTVALTLVPIVVVVLLAPDAGASRPAAIAWLLFVGSSVHVGATAWFYTVPEVRSFMWGRPVRYVAAPVALIALGAVAAVALSASVMTWLLLAFFGWQFFHFQKQNLGVSSLASRSCGVRGLSQVERRAITLAGVGGVAYLLGHPALLALDPGRHLGILEPVGLIVFVAAVLMGVVGLVRRPAADRPTAFVVVQMTSLLFFVPVFVFSSPYAAVAGITVAHGLQYLLLMGMLAAAPTGQVAPQYGVLILINLALLVGIGLNQASHLHSGGPAARALYGAYLGVVMAHFVIDAGLWRLRDDFPREFLRSRMPYLLAE